MTSTAVAWGAGAYMPDPNGPVIPQFLDFALAQVVAEYAAQGATLPARRYWTIGQEVFDCQQAVISAQTAQLGVAGFPAELTKCSGPRSLSFNLQIVRCVPVVSGRGKAPTAQSIQEASVAAALDMEIMIYDLPARFDVYQTGVVASVSAATSEGGLHGAVGSYTVNL